MTFSISFRAFIIKIRLRSLNIKGPQCHAEQIRFWEENFIISYYLEKFSFLSLLKNALSYLCSFFPEYFSWTPHKLLLYETASISECRWISHSSFGGSGLTATLHLWTTKTQNSCIDLLYALFSAAPPPHNTNFCRYVIKVKHGT